MLGFAISSHIQVFAQQRSSPLPSLSTGAGTSMLPSSTNPEQHNTKIKITSPTKGQQVSVGKDLMISGISIDNATSNDCKVSVIANKVRPYQPTNATGPGGAADYSKWNFVLTSKYTKIKPDENRITAKYECANNAPLTSFSSVNVTGVPSAATNSTNSTNSTTITGASTITNPAKAATTKPNATTIAQAQTTKIPVATKAKSAMVVPKSAITELKPRTQLTNSTFDPQSKQQDIPISSKDSTRRSFGVNGTRVAPTQIPVSSQSNNNPSPDTIAPQVKLIPQQNTKILSQEHYEPVIQNRNQNMSKTSTFGGQDISPVSSMGLTGTQRNENVGVSPPPLQSTSRSNLLSVSIIVGNDPITAGDKQSLIISVSDARSNDKVAGAKIVGQVTKSSGVANKGFRLHSDYNGQASYSWKLKQTAVAPDTYKVAATAAAPGYQEQVAAASFTVNPSMSSNTITGKPADSNNDIDANSGDLLSNRVHDFTNKILDDVKQNIKDKWTPRHFILPTPF
jgi:hypothetical protein